MADIEQVRVYEISTTVSSGLNNNEICSETVLDSDLNYYMWCGKDNAGNVTKWLAKDENARVVDLTVSGEALFADGVYDVPSISFISDPTTGMWLDSSGIFFSWAGLGVVSFDFWGNINIETAGAGMTFAHYTDLKPITSAWAGGLELKAGDTTDGARFQLSTREDGILAGHVLGRINFAAPNEDSGGVAVEVGASIVAYAEDTFSATVNKTSLSFLTSQFEGAGVKLTLNSAGNLCLGTQTTDASAVGCLALANAVAPAAHTDNQIYIYSADVDCGTAVASLAIYTEHAVRTEYVETTRTLPVTVNGVPLMLLFGEIPV